MRIVKRILKALLVLVVLAVGIAFILYRTVSRGALPDYQGEQTIKGLSSEVTVYRDMRGMPHIYAESEQDLYFSVGYVMAQERLWQMDLIRRATTGRLSEIFGEDFVKTDHFLRSLDMTNKSLMVLADCTPEIMNAMKAFSEGVNQYISDSGKKLPPEFRILGYKPDPWKLEDLANIIGYMGWDLASDNLYSDLFFRNLRQKVGEEKSAMLIPDFKDVQSTVFPGFTLSESQFEEIKGIISSMDKLQALGLSTFSGSNNWAVAGRKSSTGKPVLCNDMHLSLGSPGIWIQMHQVIKGKLNVTGVIVPGQPFVVAGHNDSIAWGMTNLMVDDIDLFAEKINPADSNQYMLDGEWHNMKIREEIIRIKGGKEEKVILRFTHRGPVISGLRGINDAVLTMRWSGYDMSNEIRSVYLLNRANNWEEFRSAISSFRAISQNFVYADRAGNIGLNTGGGIAIRKGTGSEIRPGETSEYDWKGYVPFNMLPFSYNPDTGFVSSANNRTVDSNYPFYISTEFAMPYRINRIREMLSAKQMFIIDDFKEMITDQHSDYAKLFVPQIIRACDTMQGLSDNEKVALTKLRAWDYNMGKDGIAPTVFEFLRPAFARNLLSDDLGELFDDLNGTTRDYAIFRTLTGSTDLFTDNLNTPDTEQLNGIIALSFRDAVRELESYAGVDTALWKWGSIHKMVLEHPMGSVKLLDRLFGFNSQEFSVGGSNHTVSPYSYGKGYKVNHGASERHIFNTADWDESYTVIPTGISGIPASEFYLSQAETYVNMGFYKDHFSEGAVMAGAKYVMVLKPAKKD